MPARQAGAATEGSTPGATASVLQLALALGDTVTYRVPNVLAAELCKSYTTVRGVVKALGKKAQIAVDINAPTNGLTLTNVSPAGSATWSTSGSAPRSRMSAAFIGWRTVPVTRLGSVGSA